MYTYTTPHYNYYILSPGYDGQIPPHDSDYSCPFPGLPPLSLTALEISIESVFARFSVKALMLSAVNISTACSFIYVWVSQYWHLREKLSGRFS